jgi:hypothetical protein
MLQTNTNWRVMTICWGVALVCTGGILNAQPTAQIAPVRAFDIQTVWAGRAPAGKVRQVVGGPSLYFLVSPTFSTLDSTIVRTDGGGQVEKSIKLPSKAFIQDFEVDATGTVYVLLLMSGTQQRQVLAYQPDETPARVVPVSDHVIWLCVASGAVLTVATTETGLAFAAVGSESTPLASVALRQTSSRLIVLPLPDGRMAVVEPTPGVVHLVDLRRSSEVALRPRVPEMQWLATLPPGNHTMNAAFGDGVSAPDGQIFLLLGHYKLLEGIAVVAFHMNGNLFQTVRYKVPRFPNEPELMNPSSMAIYKGATMVLVSGDGKVAEYPL